MAKNLTESAQMFDYQVQESVNPAVLCTLKGYMTYNDKPNRNKRLYPGGFWKRQVDSARIQEMLETKTFFGEAKHPGKNDSPFVELPNVSHSIRVARPDDTGVYGEIDILNTTSGRAIKTLVDYGSKLGVSTRAFGKQDEDKKGNFIPDEENYLLVTWDLVTFPAFSDARMAMSDSLEFDLTDAIPVSRETILNKAASLPEADAIALCDAVGLPFVSGHDREIQALRAQLDEAAGRIAAIEAKAAPKQDEKAAPPVSASSLPAPDSAQLDAVENRMIRRFEEARDFNKNVLSFMREQGAAVKEFDEVATVALSQKEEINSLRKANLALISLKDEVEKEASDLSSARDELEELAEQILCDFESQIEEFEEEIAERDERIATLEVQLSQTEEQVRDLLVSRKIRVSEEIVDQVTTAHPAKSKSTQPMFDTLLPGAICGSDDVSKLVDTLTKKRG